MTSEEIKTTPRDFYRGLRAGLTAWAKVKGSPYTYIEYPLLAPDFIYLLVRLMLDRRVPNNMKLKVGAVLAYYISPVDIVPEALLGPIGFGDDLILAVWMVNSLLKSVDRAVLEENWPSDLKLLNAFDRGLTWADKWMGKAAYFKLKRFVAAKIFKSE